MAPFDLLKHGLKKCGGEVLSLSQDDEKGFYNALGHTVHFSFENNWPYIVQATRNCPAKYVNHDSICYLSMRNEECSGALVVVSAIGNEVPACVNELGEVCKANDRELLIKNVGNDVKNKLMRVGFTESSMPWSRYSVRDDNSFPQMMFSFENLLSMKNWSHGNKGAVTRYRKGLNNIETALYDPRFEKEGRSLLSSYARYSFQKGKDFQEEIYRSHEFFFNETIENKIRLQHTREGKLIALHFFTPMGKTLFWNALININESNIMRILLLEALTFIRNEFGGFEHVMCQGSESRGQHEFKLSLKPIEVIPKTHMVYNG